MRKIISALADLFLGARCPGCGVAGLGICDECLEKISAQPSVQRYLPSLGVDAPGLNIQAGLAYVEPVSRLILAHKERGAWNLCKPLAKLVVDRCSIPADVVLCPIPSDSAVVRQRGYDHCFSLARAISASLGIEVKQWLVRNRRVGDQKTRDRRDRLGSQIFSMRAKNAASGRKVMIFDDVVTTGATLREGNRALQAAGADCLGALTIAATPLTKKPLMSSPISLRQG